MSLVAFGAVLGGVIGHMTTKETTKYAVVGAVGGILWDFTFNYLLKPSHPARSTTAVGQAPLLPGQFAAPGPWMVPAAWQGFKHDIIEEPIRGIRHRREQLEQLEREARRQWSEWGG